ncbi:VOC family protein [Streptomyces globisporus]
MTEVPLQINATIIDAADPERLTTFWSELLGRPIVDRSGPYVWLRREKGWASAFSRPMSPIQRRRIACTSTSHPPIRLPNSSGRGARRSAPGGVRRRGFLVMADPEGNEFCVIPGGSVSVDLDAQGRAHYLD